jgi:hypothetical protein
MYIPHTEARTEKGEGGVGNMDGFQSTKKMPSSAEGRESRTRDLVKLVWLSGASREDRGCRLSGQSAKPPKAGIFPVSELL